MTFRESRWRTIFKAVTFRFFVVVADVVVIFFITGSIKIASSVIVLTNVTSTVVYIFHERAWNRIHWGRKKHHRRKKKK